MKFSTYLKSGIKMEEIRQNHKSSQEEMLRMDLENDKKITSVLLCLKKKCKKIFKMV